MKSKDNIIKFISDIEIKKDPELANTIKNNLNLIKYKMR
jgi:hypothetical protein